MARRGVPVSATIDPVVRHMLVCDRAAADPNNPHKVDVFGLMSVIVAGTDVVLPLRHRELCVYLALTGGRGTGEGRIVVVHADSGRPAFASRPHEIQFGPNPL